MSFSDSNQKRQANGETGGNRTRGILGNHFEVLQSNIDADGADHIIRIPSKNVDDRRVKDRSISVNGILQSKFFQGRNATLIKDKYARNQGMPRNTFFTIIHSDNSSGEPVRYFLTADDVLQLPLTPDGLHRRFSITDDDDKAQYATIPTALIRERIKSGLEESERTATLDFIENVKRDVLLHFELRAGWQARESSTKYFLKNVQLTASEGSDPVEGKAVFAVIEGSSVIRAIDARWDLWPAAQTWAWGYRGTGPHLLSASILGHYLRAKAPSQAMIESFVGYLARLDSANEHVINGFEIEAIIMPHVSTPT